LIGVEIMAFIPPYPVPHRRKSSLVLRFLRGWHSWLDVLFERSYSMKMGEFSQFGRRVFMLNDTEWVPRVLGDARAYPKHGLMHRMLEPLLGSSIFTTNGATWERQRRLIEPAFEGARLKLVFELMNQAVHDMLERMDSIADGRAWEVDGEMMFVTADIIFRTILSAPLQAQQAREIQAAFEDFQRQALRAGVLMVYGLPPLFPSRASRRSAQKIRAILADIIARRWAEREAGGADYVDARKDILAGLMAARDQDGTCFSSEELLDQVCMLFLSGHETSASALTWSLYLLSHSPHLQERLVAEIEAVAPERDFGFGDLKALPTANNVFREALRLYPPVGFFVREARLSQCIRDKQVAAGSPILISPWLLHRHREVWERPDEFDPDRFDTESGKASVKCAYIPFSKGPRVCIGAAYATQEAALILASIVRRYRIEADHTHVPQVAGRVTIRSDNGVRVRLQRRVQPV
jgi:cytochrome P450